MNTSHAPERSTGAPLSADPEDFIVGGFPDILRSLPVTDLGRLWRTLGTAADRLAVFQTCRTLRNAALRHAQKVTLRVSKGPRTKAVAVLLRLAAARTYQPVSLCIDGQQGGSEICRTIIWRSTTAGPWVAVQTLMLKNLVLFDNVAGQLGRSLPYITHLTLHKVQWGLQGLLPCIPLLACQLTHLTLAGCGMSGAGPSPTPSTSSCSPSSQSSKRGDRRSRTRMPTNTPNRSRRTSGSSSSDSNNSSSNNSNRRENSSKEHGTSGLGAGAARHPPPLVHFPSVITDLAAPSYPAADCMQPVPDEGVVTSIRGSSEGRRRAEQLTPLVTSRLLLGLTTLTSLRNLTLVVHDGLQLRALTCLQHLLTSLRLGGDVVESAALVPVVASCTALRHLSWRLVDQLALGPPVHLSALIAPLTALTSIDFTPDLQPGDLQQLMAQPSVTHLRLTCPASLPGLMLQRPCSWLSLAFVPHTVRGLSQALGQSSGVTNVNAAAIRWLPLHSLTQPLDVLGIQLPPSDLPADLLTASLDNLLQPGRCRVMTVPQGLFSLLQPSGGLWCAAGESSRMMSALAPLLPHVTQLVVSGVSLNAAGVACLGAALGPRLESLTLELCQLQDSFWGVAAWVGLPHLTQLRLSSTECNAELLEVFKLALPRVVVTVRQPSRALRAAASRPVEQQWFSD